MCWSIGHYVSYIFAAWRAFKKPEKLEMLTKTLKIGIFAVTPCTPTREATVFLLLPRLSTHTPCNKSYNRVAVRNLQKFFIQSANDSKICKKMQKSKISVATDQTFELKAEIWHTYTCSLGCRRDFCPPDFWISFLCKFYASFSKVVENQKTRGFDRVVISRPRACAIYPQSGMSPEREKFNRYNGTNKN